MKKRSVEKSKINLKVVKLNNINLLQTHYERFQQNILLIKKEIRKFKSYYKEELERFTIVRELIDFKTYLNSLLDCVKEIHRIFYNRKKIDVSEFRPVYQILLRFLEVVANATNTFRDKIRKFINKCDNFKNYLTKKSINDEYYYNNEQVLDTLYDFCSELSIFSSNLEYNIEKEIYNLDLTTPKSIPFMKLFNFISFKTRDWLELNDRWACAACYLASLEISVNKACNQLNIKGKKFKEKLTNLTNQMKEDGVNIDTIEREFTFKLYDFRSRILHGGYIPDEEGFNYILKIVPGFIQNIKNFLAQNKG